MKRLGVLCARVTLPALLAVMIMTAGERIVGTTPVKSALAPTGVVWADRVFTSEAAFDRWLKARGSNYDKWAENHPAAVAASEAKQVQPQVSALAPTHLVPSRRQHTVLLTLSVAAFVALSLALALVLRHLRIAVVVPAFGRAGPPAVAGGPAQSFARNRRPARARGAQSPARVAQQRARTALVTAKTARQRVAFGARIHDPNLPPVPAMERLRFWMWRMHQRHPELAWYAVACSFALAVGAVVPLLAR